METEAEGSVKVGADEGVRHIRQGPGRFQRCMVFSCLGSDAGTLVRICNSQKESIVVCLFRMGIKNRPREFLAWVNSGLELLSKMVNY